MVGRLQIWQSDFPRLTVLASVVSKSRGLVRHLVNIASRSRSEFAKIGASTNVSFGSWMLFALPLSVVALIILWLWLQLLYVGFK